jgi:hypothetical protein
MINSESPSSLKTIKQEITDHLNDYYFDHELDDSAEDCAQELVELIIKKIDKKIKYYEQEKKQPFTSVDGWDCMDSKIKAFKEVKELLKK